MRAGIYAGSFDPITKGHQDIIRRALQIVDRLIVLVVNNPSKNYWFRIEEREKMILESMESQYQEKIEIHRYEGLLVDFMKEQGVNLLIRGLRAVSDYEYEMGYAFTNKELSQGKAETIFIPASREYMYLSSSGDRKSTRLNSSHANI